MHTHQTVLASKLKEIPVIGNLRFENIDSPIMQDGDVLIQG
jgi:hypothetical protein